MRGPLIIATLVAVAGAPRAADACSCVPCVPGGVTPSDAVPINTPHLVVLQSHDYFQQTSLPLTLWDVTAEMAVDIVTRPIEDPVVTAHYFAVFPDTLEVDHLYQLRSGAQCESTLSGEVFTFTAVPPVPLPDSLGTLRVSAVQVDDVPLANTSLCSWGQEVAFVDVEVVLSNAATPWESALHYETLLDGEPWYLNDDVCADHTTRRALGFSLRGRGRDTIAIKCERDALSPPLGSHTIQLRATIPGSDLVLTSDIVTVDFTCDLPPPPPDAGAADAAMTREDAAVDDPPRSDLLTEDPSCGCNMALAPTPLVPWLLLLPLSVWRGRVRRRTEKPPRDSPRT